MAPRAHDPSQQRLLVRRLDVAIDTVAGAGMLTKAEAGGSDATAIIFSQCETFFQTGDTAALLTDERNKAEGQFWPDQMRSQLLPLLLDRVWGRFGVWYELVPRQNAALQQTFDLHFMGIDDGNVITFVKLSADQTNTVAVAIAVSRDVDELWPPRGDTLSSSMAGAAIVRRWRITSPASDQPSTGAASSCGSSRTAIPPCTSVVWREVAP